LTLQLDETVSVAITLLVTLVKQLNTLTVVHIKLLVVLCQSTGIHMHHFNGHTV